MAFSHIDIVDDLTARQKPISGYLDSLSEAAIFALQKKSAIEFYLRRDDVPLCISAFDILCHITGFTPKLLDDSVTGFGPLSQETEKMLTEKYGDITNGLGDGAIDGESA